jgi:hypothetical protein
MVQIMEKESGSNSSGPQKGNDENNTRNAVSVHANFFTDMRGKYE